MAKEITMIVLQMTVSIESEYIHLFCPSHFKLVINPQAILECVYKDHAYQGFHCSTISGNKK